MIDPFKSFVHSANPFRSFRAFRKFRAFRGSFNATTTEYTEHTERHGTTNTLSGDPAVQTQTADTAVRESI